MVTKSPWQQNFRKKTFYDYVHLSKFRNDPLQISELRSKECFPLINRETCYNKFHLTTKYRLIFGWKILGIQ